MIRAIAKDPSKEFIAFVRSWFNLVAENRLEEACAALDEANSYGVTWSPTMIEKILEEEFGPGTLFGNEHAEGVAVSSTENTVGEARADVVAFSDGSGFSVEHDVPLNGVWSDLTAQFEFKRYQQGYAVVLHDLHVL